MLPLGIYKRYFCISYRAMFSFFAKNLSNRNIVSINHNLRSLQTCKSLNRRRCRKRKLKIFRILFASSSRHVVLRKRLDFLRLFLLVLLNYKSVESFQNIQNN